MTERPARVLVVEDDEEIAQVLQRSLRLEGYEVRIAGDGEAALEQASAFNPDLVILDLGLPDGDGLALLAGLRRRGGAVPVLVLTARDAVENRVAGLDTGADDYLVKPFAMTELVARAKALLRRPGHALGLTMEAGDPFVRLPPAVVIVNEAAPKETWNRAHQMETDRSWARSAETGMG